MGNLVDLAKLLGVDPAYLGAVLARLGLAVARDGSVDLPEVLKRLAERPDLLGAEVAAPMAALPAPGIPLPPAVEASKPPLTELPGQMTLPLEKSLQPGMPTCPRKRVFTVPPIQRVVAREEAFQILAAHQIEAVWESNTYPRENWVILSNNARAYLAARKVRKDQCMVSTGIPTGEKFDFLLVSFARWGKTLLSTGVLAYTAEELREWKTQRSVDYRDWYRVPYSKEYLIGNRVELFR